MSDLDEKKPTGKAGKRKRNADQRSRRPDQKQPPKADQVQSAKAQIDALLVASSDPAPIEAAAVEAQTDTAIAAARPVPTAPDIEADAGIATTETTAVAVQDVAEPSAVLMTPSDTAPVAEQQPDVAVVTADALPVIAPVVSAPSVAAMSSAEAAPIAAAEVKQQVASAAPATAPYAAPSPIADAPVSLQTIAEAYGEFTRKSLEQTKCFLDKLTAVRSLDQAVEIQTEFARNACETFVAEAQKITDLHRELARQRFGQLGGFMSMGKQSSRWM